MLKKLRLKFIALNMLMVTVVVVAVLSAIGIANYQQSMSAVYSSLDEAVSDTTRVAVVHGPFSRDLSSEPLYDNGEKQQRSESSSESSAEEAPSLSMPQLGKSGGQYIPIAIYEGKDGQYNLVNQMTTAFLDESTLTHALEVVKASSSERGEVAGSNLLYVKRTVNEFEFIAFTDASNAPDWKGLIFILVGIGFLTLVVFFVISVFFSRWALKPVEKAWEQQRQFVADASHELKTPLTVILTNMSILKNHPTDSVASQSQWIESTQREAQGMHELVLGLLDLASVEDSKIELSSEPVELSEMVESRLLQIESFVFENGLFLDYSVDENIQVMGEKSRLERLLVILLDNACKYATPNSTVYVALNKGPFVKPDSSVPFAVKGDIPKESCAVLSVHNEGRAISKEDLPHIFDRFYRSDKARVRSEGNYGLGLAIASETAIAHKGCTMVQSSEEKGTTFTVAIPLEK